MKKILAIILIMLIALLPSCSPADSSALTVDVLNVGKADCSILRYQNHVIVIDTAEEENVGEVIGFLQGKGIKKIDYLIHSHFDKDHIGGSKNVLSQFDIGMVIESTFSSDRAEYNSYHEIIEKNKVPLKQITEPITLTLSDLIIQIDPPQKNAYDRKQDNNASLMVSITLKNTSYLFCGDAMEERIEEFVAGNQRTYDVVKLPYHGNYLNNYENFLENIKPEVGIICCSEKNPAEEDTLQLLKEKGISTYQTRFGTIHISTNRAETKISYQ